MIQYYLRAIFLSVSFSRSFYYDLVGARKIFGGFYVILLAGITAFFMTFQIDSILTQITEEFSELSIKGAYKYNDLKDIRLDIKNNQIAVEQDQPIIIDNKENETVIVIDTKNQMKNYDIENGFAFQREGLLYFFQGNQFILPASDLKQNLGNLSELQGSSDSMNLQEFITNINMAGNIPVVIIYIIATLWMSIKFYIKVLLLSFAAGFFLNMMVGNRSFTYRANFRIAAFTLTPIALLESLSYILSTQIFVYRDIVYFVMQLVYIYFAVESYKKLSLFSLK